MAEQTRNRSIDLLKCVSMLMVVALHATGADEEYGLGGVTFPGTFSAIAVFSGVLNAFSRVAVDCFVLITGYFLSASNAKVGKAIKLWGTAFLYSFGFYLLLCIVPFSSTSFSLKEAIHCAFPVSFRQYWFFTAYFILFLVSPYLNLLIDALSKRQHQYLLMTLFALFVILTSVFVDYSEANGGFSLCWFVVLYLTAAYLRKHPLPRLPYGWIYLGLSALTAISLILSERIPKETVISNHLIALGNYNSILVFPAAVSLFLCYTQHPISADGKIGRWISKVASLTFGVYLLHEHPYLRPIIWQKIVRLSRFETSTMKFICIMLFAIIGVFVAGIVIEWLRSLVFRPLDRWILKKTSKKKLMPQD